METPTVIHCGACNFHVLIMYPSCTYSQYTTVDGRLGTWIYPGRSGVVPPKQELDQGGGKVEDCRKERVGCAFVLILTSLCLVHSAAIETFESPSSSHNSTLFYILLLFLCCVEFAIFCKLFPSVLRCRSWLSRAAFCVVCYSCSHQSL
ncbi:hypothetical protein F4776DRAFT_505773 [Hypoxylon sp. NC0597]|nr:hypothetical protein F4776DRAFT_505773 [Hypoxylon sp. NC0597]